jgi:DNA-binding NarL/FixJ family response regulator
LSEITVMLVDDHVMVREGTRELLDREQDMRVVAEAGDGEAAVRLASTHVPDVIVMDVALPVIDGIEATKRIKLSRPSATVLVLSAYDDDQYVFALLEAGAAGYLLKDVSSRDLIEAIRAVHAGESILHPSIARKVIDYFSHHAGAWQQNRNGSAAGVQLTERELEVLEQAARGLTNREIAQQLSISVRTVQVHLSNIFGKLGVGSRTEAVLYAVRKGWLELEEPK